MNRYPAVAEVAVAARRLVSGFPGAGRLRRIGTSRAGRAIEMLSVGHGPRHVLVVAGPHPDEPVTGATALALAEALLRRAAARAAGIRRVSPAEEPAGGADTGAQCAGLAGEPTSPATDLDLVTWDFVLCLDPDGAAVAEGGSGGAVVHGSLRDHHRTAFRPTAAEQPEWAPILGRRLPESRALFTVVEELRPVLQCSLHGVEAGGSWVQSTRELPCLQQAFAGSAAQAGIPLAHSTYDALNWDSPGPGVFVLPADRTDRLAVGWDDIALSTWGAPARYGGVTAIVEVPMWASDLVADPSPYPAAAEALRDAAALVREGGRQVTAVLDRARPLLPPAAGSPPLRVLEWMADGLYDLVADSWSPFAGQPLTTAQVVTMDMVARRQPLRAGGLLLRLLGASDDPAAPALYRELDELFTAWCADFDKAFRLREVPVPQQVAHQARTVVAAADSALAGATA